MRFHSLLACSLLLLTPQLTACGDDGSGDDEAGTEDGTGTDGGTDTGTGDESGETTTTTDTGTESSTDTGTESSTDTGTESSTDTGTDTGSETDTGVMDTGTDTGGNLACEPAPNDTPCDECVKSSCCEQISACLDEADCACVAGCVGDGGDPATCHQECGLMDPNLAFGMFATCVQQQCMNECAP